KHLRANEFIVQGNGHCSYVLRDKLKVSTEKAWQCRGVYYAGTGLPFFVQGRLLKTALEGVALQTCVQHNRTNALCQAICEINFSGELQN
ncbi:MAG: hypothetical protein FWF77_04020, partial [Defluviitaleaceae bacterium]|nr:hypothetical protein [Defluviitaleaceae bacterium]